MNKSQIEAIVVTENLVKEFKMGPQIIRAVDGANLSLPRGKVIAIEGVSGCGKTTLLNLIGALERPTEGRVVVDGIEVTSLSGGEEVEYRRRKVGLVFQNYYLVPNLSALENVTLPMDLAGVPRRLQTSRARDLLQRVGIGPERYGHHPSKLSGGEQQRVVIARALANSPSLILADEPTGNLDRATGAQIIKLLFQLVEGEDKTVLVVTHDPSIGQRAHLTLKMVDGKIQPAASLPTSQKGE